MAQKMTLIWKSFFSSTGPAVQYCTVFETFTLKAARVPHPLRSPKGGDLNGTATGSVDPLSREFPLLSASADKNVAPTLHLEKPEHP
jgi:hypothetical protein